MLEATMSCTLNVLPRIDSGVLNIRSHYLVIASGTFSTRITWSRLDCVKNNKHRFFQLQLEIG
jgi:hypothetical protein